MRLAHTLPETFFERAMARSGSMRTAMLALVFLVEWGRCSQEARGSVSVEEYCERTGVSRSQGFRRQQAFVECFPNVEIADMWSYVRPFLDRRGRPDRTSESQAVIVGALAPTKAPAKGDW